LDALKQAGEAMSGALDTARDAIARHLPPGKSPEELYPFEYNFIAPVAMLKGTPVHDLPRLAWIRKFVQVTARVLDNMRKVKGKSEGAAEKLASLVEASPLRLLFQNAKELRDAEVETVRASLAARGAEAEASFFGSALALLRSVAEEIKNEPAQSPGDFGPYRDLFVEIPLPKIADDFQSDAVFAELRVAGPNPTSLFRASSLAECLGLSEEAYREIVSGDSLATALREGRLYALDYRGKTQTLSGTYLQWQKYTAAPRALFAVPPRGMGLVPVAILPAENAALVTPRDGSAWELAKSVVNVADANYHELVCHLGRTHLVVEPFVVSTKRKLPEAHPLRRLLEPHFEGTLFINWAAGQYLVAPGGFVDILLSGTVDADRVAAVLGTASRSFHDSYLPRWLAAQGVEDASKLPHYPFRDDALLLWEAIGAWTRDYTALYWPDAASIAKDEALQAWARELASFEGGRVSGFGEEKDGTIKTPEYLAGALQMLIFTGSAQHAAVNFPQGDLMDYAPAMPLAGYTALPKGEVSAEAWRQYLPPREQALNQINILYILGSVYHTRLGDYEDGAFTDEKVRPALRAFQERLRAIESEITRRNEARSVPYHYLLPSQIPQSINV
jgi:arachidonate 15-lipoxygenase